jgi:hypothetical protein
MEKMPMQDLELPSIRYNSYIGVSPETVSMLPGPVPTG